MQRDHGIVVLLLHGYNDHGIESWAFLFLAYDCYLVHIEDALLHWIYYHIQIITEMAQTINLDGSGRMDIILNEDYDYGMTMTFDSDMTGTLNLLVCNEKGSAPIQTIPAALTGTATGAAAAAVTLTLAAPGAGLFHYISRLIIQRHTSAALTAAATPIIVTTTNLPGSRAFSFPADAAAQGVVAQEIMEPCIPLKSSAANTATTIVCPATTGVIWRVTADYYIGA